jgi:mannose-1-phosphate guanylyltransferase/mannose-6-phosphate isomerase
VRSDRHLVATVGVDNLIVVATDDAVLVADKSHAQGVKEALDLIRAKGFGEAAAHSEVHRPWGSYRSVISGDRFQVKLITVKPGGRLSLQLHRHRAEHWVVVKGTAQITCGEKVFMLYENQSTYIPQGETHRLENLGHIPLEMIEVQSGSYLGEDDIVRVEDVYGRS